MINYIQAGENLTVAAPADVQSGEGVLIGGLFGVATGDALTGENVTLVRRGVFELPKTEAEAWTVGQILYWDAGNAVVTSVATANTMIGMAAQVAANPTTTGLVLLPGIVAVPTA